VAELKHDAHGRSSSRDTMFPRLKGRGRIEA